jgi:hypothetical protein
MSETNGLPVAPHPAHPPAHGHVTGATRFEESDASAKMVISSLSIIALVLVGSFALTIGIQKYLEKINPVGDLPSPLAPARVLPPDPQIEVHPWDYLPQLRAHEDQELNSAGRDANGRTHVPIASAMDAVLPSLKIKPGAPAGITTPGGEGRSPAGGDGVNRVPYRIEIRGGAQTNAQ